MFYTHIFRLLLFVAGAHTRAKLIQMPAYFFLFLSIAPDPLINIKTPHSSLKTPNFYTAHLNGFFGF